MECMMESIMEYTQSKPTEFGSISAILLTPQCPHGAWCTPPAILTCRGSSKYPPGSRRSGGSLARDTRAYIAGVLEEDMAWQEAGPEGR